MPSLSIIIPCYRDHTQIAVLLQQLRTLSVLPNEIIVVDAAGDSACQAICMQYDAQWHHSEPCRGKQLLQGAQVATGDILWFLHADTRVSPNSISSIMQAVERGAIGGYFRFVFDGPPAWPMLILEPAIALRSRFGTPYGDQGIFVKRTAYFKVGGHAPWPLFEEVPLVKGLRNLGHFQPLLDSIWVDSRRWQRDGWWHRTLRNRMLALKFILGASPDTLAKSYHSQSS